MSGKDSVLLKQQLAHFCLTTVPSNALNSCRREHKLDLTRVFSLEGSKTTKIGERPQAFFYTTDPAIR